MLKRQKGDLLVSQLRNAIKEAHKRNNIPKLNDISETILSLVVESQNFRIRNRHIEPEQLYKETNQLIDLYSQVLRLVSRMEFARR